MIFSLLKQKKTNRRIVARQYDSITAAARRPAFYRAMDVPDTVMGRFEMLAVHLVLYFRHSRMAPAAGRSIAQEIMDAFFEDIDHSMRELGVGDTSVPKRMKKFGRMFFGRVESYEQALENRDEAALAAALTRNIFPEAAADAPSMASLAAYMVACDDALRAAGPGAFETGMVAFPAVTGEPGDSR